ncbi:MAG: cytochrome c biogenesis protein CcdA, partial [Bacteroidota bacterium]
MAEVTLIVAFVAGLLSFLSPCVLPLVPAFTTFKAGTSFKEIEQNVPGIRLRIFLSSVMFVLGFSVVFSILGVLLQGVLSNVAYDVRTYLNYLGGAIIIFFGLFLMGLVKIDFLQKEHKLDVRGAAKFRYLGSFVFGAAFAVGWTPCVGAVLGGVLTLAATRPEHAFP